MHDRIADDDHIANLSVLLSRSANQLLDQASDLFADQLLQPVLPMIEHGEVNPAHDISAVAGLGIQCGLHGEHTAGPQVEQLRGEGGCAQVYRDAQSFSRLESEGRFVRQDSGIPLPEFDLQIAFKDALTGKPPSLGNFVSGKNFLLSGIDLRIPAHHSNPATSATALAAAGEFHALFKKQIAERRSRGRGQFRMGRLQDDSTSRTLSQGDSSECVLAAENL